MIIYFESERQPPATCRPHRCFTLVFTEKMPHPYCARLCKFPLTSAHSQDTAFNIPIFSFQKISDHKMPPEKPVPGISHPRFAPSVLRKSPFRTPIKPISRPDIGHITTRNGPYRSAKWALSQNEENASASSFTVNRCQTTVYKNREILRFFAQNSAANDFRQILGDFKSENLTSPSAFFVFLSFGVLFCSALMSVLS